MSAGYIQLAAIGQQDAYLSGEPQVTYFSGVYKRHTPFVLETYDIPFKEQLVNYGGTSICQIPPKGDLIRGLTLKVVLPALTNPGNDWTWPQTPSNINYPLLWFGLTNGTIVSASASFQYQYYSSNSISLAQWFTPNFGNYAKYSSATNKFSFSNVSVGLSNVIVSAGQPGTSALSGVFWGLDPLAASTVTSSNLIYNAVSGVVTPSLTLEQSGWIQTAGLPVNPLSGMYLTLNQTLPLSGQQFINFSGTSISGAYWTANDLLVTAYNVTNGGCIKFSQIGYYTVRAGFSVGLGGSIQTVAYGTSSIDGQPSPPVFTYVYNSIVSPDPSSPVVMPLIVTDTTLYYYFYATTNGTQLLPGTYFSVSPTDDIYQFSSNIVLSGTSMAPVPLYGNVTPSNSLVKLNTDSTMSFTTNGEYLISGILSLTDPSYISNISIGERSNILYTYDTSLQGRNPTYAFSIPLVANTQLSYYLNVSTTGSLSNLNANSFFAIDQIGVLSDTQPGIVLPYNGILFQSTSNTLTTPLQLKSPYFSSNTNSVIVSTTPQGNLSFNNVMSYMMTGVFYTSNAVTSLTIGSSDPAFSSPVYKVALGLAPPYTFSVPFRVSNTKATYSISLGVNGTTANVLAGTYISVVPLASNTSSGSIGATYSYYDSVATYLVHNAELKIGGQTIQSITGEYIEIWNELNVPYENQPGLQLLTGKYDTGTSVGPPGRVYYANLPFYFYGSPELSIPITALGRQDVEVWVTFRNFSELTAVQVTNPTLTATIITDYVYLSNPEINWFQSHRLDYVITQTQFQTFDLPEGFQTAIFPLEFKGPVKELFFVIQPVGNLPYNYVVPGSKSPDLASLGMTFNGEDAFLTTCTNALYVGAIEPFNHHVNFFSSPPVGAPSTISSPGRQFYMYAFSTNPSAGDPSGSINFSRIRNVLLELNVFNSSAFYPAKQFRIVAASQNILRVENGIAGLMFE
jgi:Large eukaryotic DNA virus major capsid protein/Major capsid protein N-terminus